MQEFIVDQWMYFDYIQNENFYNSKISYDFSFKYWSIIIGLKNTKNQFHYKDIFCIIYNSFDPKVG